MRHGQCLAFWAIKVSPLGILDANTLRFRVKPTISPNKWRLHSESTLRCFFFSWLQFPLSICELGEFWSINLSIFWTSEGDDIPIDLKKVNNYPSWPRLHVALFATHSKFGMPHLWRHITKHKAPSAHRREAQNRSRTDKAKRIQTKMLRRAAGRLGSWYHIYNICSSM